LWAFPKSTSQASEESAIFPITIFQIWESVHTGKMKEAEILEEIRGDTFVPSAHRFP
jgi:hypothetical protein